MELDVSFADILAAQERLAPYLPPTPCVRSAALSEKLGAEVWLKLESQQPSGSFKVRPALNSMLVAQRQARERGVVTSSSGNFAQGVAYAGTMLGISTQIVMMRGASDYKRRRTERFGGEVVPCGDDFSDRWTTTERVQQETGRLLVHPFNSVETIAGDGVAGTEIYQHLAKPFDAIVPVSGGGLLSGIAIATRHHCGPDARILGVQPERNGAWAKSWEAGEPVTIELGETAADALIATRPGDRTYRVVRHYGDGIALVTEDQMWAAVRFLAEEQKIVAEPGGAVAVAALLAGAVVPVDRPVVCVISGGNILPAALAHRLAG